MCRIPPFSKIELRAELQEPSVHDAGYILPAGPIGGVEPEPIARVQRVSHVEIDRRAVAPARPEAEDFGEPQVELIRTRPVLRSALHRGGGFDCERLW